MFAPCFMPGVENESTGFGLNGYGFESLAVEKIVVTEHVRPFHRRLCLRMILTGAVAAAALELQVEPDIVFTSKHVDIESALSVDRLAVRTGINLLGRLAVSVERRHQRFAPEVERQRQVGPSGRQRIAHAQNELTYFPAAPFHPKRSALDGQVFVALGEPVRRFLVDRYLDAGFPLEKSHSSIVIACMQRAEPYNCRRPHGDGDPLESGISPIAPTDFANEADERFLNDRVEGIEDRTGRRHLTFLFAVREWKWISITAL